MVALEEALHPAGPRRALHRAIEARLRWVEEVGGVAAHLEREELRILVEDGRELRRQRRGKRAVEPGGGIEGCPWVG